MRYRALLVLATIAALLGAPSIASGAPKGLASPSVTPGSGTVATVFTLTVRYEGQVPATGVTVAVGGQVMPMTRVGGTARSGTWAASGTLPAGTWAPVFAATAERGDVATVTASLVSVLGPVVPPPTPDPSVAGSPKSPRETTVDGTPIEAQDPDAGGGETPVAAPADEDTLEEDAAEDPAVAAPATTPEPADGSVTTPTAPPGGTAAGTARTNDGAATGSAAPASGGDEPAAGPAAPSSGSSVREDEPGTGGDGPSARGQELLADDASSLGTVLILVLAGIAGVAILGTGWLMAWRRRGGGTDQAGTRAAATDAVLARRTLRRARVRLDEDPIVAALGIDDQPTRRARRSARQVSRGPGDRPTDRR